MLSLTEAKMVAAVMVAQDMLYVYWLLELVGLNIELAMVLEMNDSGAVDIANSWSVSGKTRHVDVQNYFLRKLKDQGLLVIKHIPGDTNDADIFTKNVTSAMFNQHVPLYVGVDEYVSVHDWAFSGEAVRE